jgi:hypothetical protein
VHNQYVAQLLRTGWLGSTLTAASILLLLRLRRGGPGSAAAAATLAYVLVTGWTSPSLFTYPTNLLAGLAIGAAPLIDAAWRRSAGRQATPAAVCAAPLPRAGQPAAVSLAAAVPEQRTGQSPSGMPPPRSGHPGPSGHRSSTWPHPSRSRDA